MKHLQHPLISPVPGTQRTVHSFEYGPENASRTVYIQSSLHADELPGMLVAWKLKQQLRELETQGMLNARIIVVPVANPLGLDQQLMDTPLGRYHLETLGNFNRHYVDVSTTVIERAEGQLTEDSDANARLLSGLITESLEALTPHSEVESLKLTLQRLASQAQYVLDLHCDFTAVEHLYTTPDSWETFKPLACYFGSHASMLEVDSGGESFDECHTLIWERLRQHFGDRYPIPYGCASITIELRGQGDVTDELAERDAKAILDWMRHQQFITEQAPPLPSLLYPATPLDAMDFVTAPIGGLVVFQINIGEQVEEGALIAYVIDPITDQKVDVRAPQAGVVYARNSRHMATAGMIIADVAGTHRHRSGYLLAP